MNTLFAETRRQMSAIRTALEALLRMRALVALVGAGLATIVLWYSGLFAMLLKALPEWAHVPVMMPLFGSMLAIYALGGLATTSLMLSAVYDLAMLPVRRFLSLRPEGV